MRLPIKIFVLLIPLFNTCAFGQSREYKCWLLTQRLPDWANSDFEMLGLDSNYAYSDFINPFYLEADLNGDNELDIAIAIKEIKTGKKGFVVLHHSKDEYFVFGAGTSFGNGGDDFNWMDVWKVNRDPYFYELTYSDASEIEGSKKGSLKFPGIEVIKSESAGGLIYWDGSKYQWAQTSD